MTVDDDNDLLPEPTEVVIHFCGHGEQVVSRCAVAYQRRYCSNCALMLPKPSDCLRRFMGEHGNVDHFGPMLGPIGAVIYARQTYFNLSGMLAWSGSEAMHEAIVNFEPTRQVTPYIQRFAAVGQ